MDSSSRSVPTRLQQSFSLRQRIVPRAGQSIQLLQMSHLELADAIQQELDENPLLEAEEREPEFQEDSEGNGDTFNDEDWDESERAEWLKEQLQAAKADNQAADVGELDRLDPNESIEGEIEWDDRLDHLDFQAHTAEGENASMLENRARPQSLTECLTEQLELSNCSAVEAQIASVIFETLDEDGFIAFSDVELLREVNEIVECTEELLEDVLALVQDFAPLGVCARDLRECLMIQTRASNEDPAVKSAAMRILRDYFAQLASVSSDDLSDIPELDSDSLQQALAFITGLNPRPASCFSEAVVEFIEPEARIVKVAGNWEIEQRENDLPNLKISAWYEQYRDSVRHVSQSKEAEKVTQDRKYLQNQHARAKLFLSSLRFRQLNVMKVIAEIVKKQQAFFEHGPGAMRPLILADVADEIGLHASTVSRLTTRKYIETPHGILELKYFFSNRVGNQVGSEHSGVAIRSVVKELIHQEDPKHPLSDQKISLLLREKNIEISRRTVTKYREAMSIPASRERLQVA